MKNVLIVEDDEIIAWEVAKHLSLWQMKCTVVEDFQRVIETFNECDTGNVEKIRKSFPWKVRY